MALKMKNSILYVFKIERPNLLYRNILILLQLKIPSKASINILKGIK